MTHKVSFERFCPECGLALTENSPRQCWEAWIEHNRKKFAESSEVLDSVEHELTVTPKNHDRIITVTITVTIAED